MGYRAIIVLPDGHNTLENAIILAVLRCYSGVLDGYKGINPFTDFLKIRSRIDNGMTPKLIHLDAIKELLVSGAECSKIRKRDTLNCFSTRSKTWSGISFVDLTDLEIAAIISGFEKKCVILDNDSGEFRQGIQIPKISFTNFDGIENCDTVCVILKKQSEFFTVSLLSRLITGSPLINYICSECKQFVAKSRHDCFQPVCRACGLSTCGGGGYDNLFRHQCRECANYFFDADCAEVRHKVKDWCVKNTFCTTCTYRYSRENGATHVCGEIQCKNCRVFFHPLAHHSCQMWKKFTQSQIDELDFTPPAFTRVKKPLDVFGVYDFETACLHTAEQQVVCGQFMIGGKVFTSWSIEEFLLQILRPEYDGKHFFAHNGSKFDALFVMNGVAELAKNNEGVEVDGGRLYIDSNNSVINGRKLLYVEITFYVIPNTRKRKKVSKKTIILRDSHLLFLSSLRGFSASMGVTQRKSFFPYKLLRNILTGELIIPKPSKEIFEEQVHDPDFEKWYRELPELFDVKKEVEKYCLIDIEVLYKCLEKFQQSFLPFSNGIDPLTFKTAASFAQNVFLSMFAPTHSPGKTSLSVLTAIRVSEKSVEETEYIRYILNKYPDAERDPYLDFVTFDHSVNLYYNENLTIYCFRSCYITGHNCSSFNESKRSVLCENEFQRFKTSFSRMDTEIMYECEWKKFKSDNLNLSHLWAPNLFGDSNGMDVFKINGGVVEVFTSKYSCSVDEEIVCYDVVSEYPSVQCYCPYPVGNVFYYMFMACDIPMFTEAMMNSVALLDLVQNMKTDKPIVVKYFGVFHVKILPPQDLEYPVIPGNWNGKRYFATCSKCAFSENPDICEHSDKERSWWITLTTMDIVLALVNGYKLLDIFEGWYFKESCVNWVGGDYTLKQDCFLLFKDYVEKLMVIKKKSGENGDKALRSVSKLLLNSLWGKLGQRNKYKGRAIIFKNDSTR